MKFPELASIILPVYNVELFLEECLNSILTQNYGNIEIIAINDGSKDRSLEILETFATNDSRIKIINQDNKGLSGARNTGLSNAKGAYIFFIDSDDIVEPNLVERCVLALKTDSTDLVLFNHADFFPETGKKTIDRVKMIDAGSYDIHNFMDISKKLKTDAWLPVCFYAYKKSFLELHKLRFYVGILHEDIDFTIRSLVYSKKISVLSDLLYLYRRRIGSITTDATKIEKSLTDHLKIVNSLFSFAKTIHDKNKKLFLNNFLSTRYLYVINKCFEADNLFSAKLYKEIIASARRQRQVCKHLPKDFYQEHIETKAQRNKRVLIENIIKWPRRIYKYQIKSRL